MYKLLSFDVYGTLINTPPINVKAFRLILEEASASNIDALKAHPVVPGSPICGMRMPCGGRLRRAREGIEWLRARSASRQSGAGQKAVELPPACRQAARGSLKRETEPRFRLAPSPRSADEPG